MNEKRQAVKIMQDMKALNKTRVTLRLAFTTESVKNKAFILIILLTSDVRPFKMKLKIVRLSSIKKYPSYHLPSYLKRDRQCYQPRRRHQRSTKDFGEHSYQPFHLLSLPYQESYLEAFDNLFPI